MSQSNSKKRVLYTFLSALAIIGGTILAINYAKGNLRFTEDGFARETGLLQANSFPIGAEVTINGRQVAVTDDTIYLSPAEYEVEILKDGYAPWKKVLEAKKGLVTQTNARLFPIAPSLTTLTFTGAENIMPSPDGQKIVYYTASTSATRRHGLYLMELTTSTFSLQKGPRQLTQDSERLDLREAKFIWSPDSSEILVIDENREVLLPLDRTSDIDALPDVSFQRSQILGDWEYEMYLRERQYLSRFPQEIIAVATASAKNLYFSPDLEKSRMLYTATQVVTIPDNLIPAVSAASTQLEERTLEPGGIYVYDRKEDRNFRVAAETETASEAYAKQLLALDMHNSQPQVYAASPSAFQTLQATASAQTARNFITYHSSLFANTLQWYPDSNHLIYVEDNKIKIMGYDSANKTTLYSGPFSRNFVYPWPDGNRLLITTTFSPDSPPNIYAIELK
jgi:hypothetical protein